MFTEEIKQQLKEILSAMKDEVHIRFLTDAQCPSCADAEVFIETLVSLSEKLRLETVPSAEQVPAFELSGTNYPEVSIRFNGIPGGHEINSFLQTIIELSGLVGELPAALAERVRKIDRPTDIKVFVTLGCPHCPGAVSKANRLAMENPLIKAQMIEAQTFHKLSEKYNVSSVPRIVINETYTFVGNQPLEKFIEGIEAR